MACASNDPGTRVKHHATIIFDALNRRYNSINIAFLQFCRIGAEISHSEIQSKCQVSSKEKCVPIFKGS